MYEKLSQLRDSMAEAWLLYTAIDIGLFDFINRGEANLKEIYSKFGYDQNITMAFMESLARSGYLKKVNENYKLTESTIRFLCRSSQDYVGDGVYIFKMYKNFEDCVKTLKKSIINVDSKLWEYITKSTARVARTAVLKLVKLYPALISQKVTILDVGCGRGDYIKTLSGLNPNLEAIGIEFDEKVIAYAIHNLKEEITSGRVKIIKADFHKDRLKYSVKKKVDFVLLNSIMHIVGSKTCTTLTNESYEILDDKGVILILEIFKDIDSSPFPAYFDLNMKMHHREGKCFQLSEMKNILENAGFNQITYNAINQATPYLGYITGAKNLERPSKKKADSNMHIQQAIVN